MTKKKMTWREIESKYHHEWVQLVDYDWPEEEPLPRSGIVGAHAKTRKKFDSLILKNPQKESALLFVGKREIPAGVVLSANLHQWGSQGR